jgi:PDZ domain-containing protein
MEPRTVVLVLSGFLTVLSAALVSLIPVPYVVLTPGPVINTLGTVEGKKLITVSGHATYPPTRGELNLTTVSLSGGPGSRIGLLPVLQGWLSESAEVVPEETLYPPGQSAEEEEQLGEAQMVDSQESATAAALTSLGIRVPMTIRISDEDAGTPASKILRGGDVLLGVEGRQIADLRELRTVLDLVPAGREVRVRIRRDGRQRDVRVRTVEGTDGRTVLGVYVDPDFRFPFQVRISIDNVGGPSAGTMFALGIVDMLTPGDLTGGELIAGTGTIEPDGAVGAIGGIRQKLLGARRGGARWFLAPEGNCEEVVGHVPDGLEVVSVSTLDDALVAVRAIAAAQGVRDLPRCERSQ